MAGIVSASKAESRALFSMRHPGIVLFAALALNACSRPVPRSFDFFLEDPIVRDGVIARCDAHPLESEKDIECANARRAATAEQLR
jgi:hypothetical protein